MKCTTDFGTYEVRLRRTKYCNNDNMAIFLKSDGAPFATITVNLDTRLPENFAFVDTNNCPWAPAFIEEHNLGRPTGCVQQSGYCVYPLYQFDFDKIDEVSI